MRQRRFRAISFRGVGLGVGLLAVAAVLTFSRHDPRSEPGETWRRGFLSGDEIRLLDNGRYRVARWCRVCTDEVTDSGTWAQLGSAVSLVPGRPDQPPRLMRKSVRDGERYLFDPTEAGTSTEREAAMFVLVD